MCQLAGSYIIITYISTLNENEYSTDFYISNFIKFEKSLNFTTQDYDESLELVILKMLQITHDLITFRLLLWRLQMLLVHLNIQAKLASNLSLNLTSCIQKMFILEWYSCCFCSKTLNKKRVFHNNNFFTSLNV